MKIEITIPSSTEESNTSLTISNVDYDSREILLTIDTVTNDKNIYLKKALEIINLGDD